MSNSTSLLQKARTSAENLGTVQFAHFVARCVLNRILRPTHPYRLYSRYSRVPLWLRPHTSDLDVFDQIFRYREYRCLDPIRDARLIDSMVIELHGKECEEAFFAAIAGQGFEVSTCDELTVYLRSRPVR